MFSRDNGSGRWTGPPEADDLEASIVSLSARIREVTQLVRALTPVANELQALQEAAAQLQAINLERHQPVVATSAAPAALPAVDAIAGGSSPPQLLAALASRSEQAPPSSRPRPSGSGTVQVTIARLNGPLEPVRIRRGLATLAGVRDVALVQREQSRLTVIIDTDQEPEQLPIAEALAMVFDQDVTGEWTGDGEYLAVIEGSPEAPGHT